MVPNHSVTATDPGSASERHPITRPPCGSYSLRKATICCIWGAVTPRFPRLPEENAGVVAEVDDGVAHDFHALFPLAAFSILFLIAGGRHLDDAQPVER